MPGSRSRVVLMLGVLTFAPGAASFADQAPPDWLREVAATAVPDFEPGVPAATILLDRTVTVEANGRITTTERGAILVLTLEGRDAATCDAYYVDGDDRVAGMAAWLISRASSPRAFGRKDWVDEQLVSNDLYSEVRHRFISAAYVVSPGMVFGYEWTTQGHSASMQRDWLFQDGGLPALVSRVTLRLPSGWHATGITFNHEPIAPSSDGDVLRWELRDLPPVREEPSAPPLSAIVPRLAVTFGPDAPRDRESGTMFESWQQASRWLATLSDPQARLDETLRARAVALVAGDSDDLGRIRAIGTFVQGLNYVSISTGLERGGGVTPHAARRVLETGYGDCKDKANLMRALLSAVDIPSWLVSICSGDPAFVRQEWPAPGQFNHCIIAIRAPPDLSSPARLDHESLGPLVLFDPTDPFTPLGDLPRTDQGSLALIVGADRGCLIRAPVSPPEANVIRREIDAKLGPAGGIEASIRESSTGGPASVERALRSRSREAEYRRLLEAWVGRGVPGARVGRVAPADDRDAGRFTLELDFTADHCGRRVSDELYAICPALVSRRESFAFAEPERTLPIVLTPELEEETVHIRLPAAFAVEALPDSVNLDTDFGRYRSSCTAAAGNLYFSRTLEVRRTTLPPARYAEVQDFFKAVRKAETAMVLLRAPS